MANSYDVFISYRHTELDSKVAKRIQRQLEHYHIPSYIRKRTGRKNGFRVFRDKDELPVTDDLGDVLHTALRESSYLIVICSPDTAESLWVKREIEYFIETHDRSHVLTVLADGDPDQVIPEILLMKDENGKEKELVASDYRKSAHNNRHNELHRLAAALLGCNYSELVNRAEKNAMLRLSLSVMAVSFVITMLAYNNYQVNQANKQLAESLSNVQRMNKQLEDANSQIKEANEQLYEENQEGLRKESRLLAVQSEQALEEENKVDALKYALEALPGKEKDRPVVAEAERALVNATGIYSDEYELELKKRFAFNADGNDIADLSITNYNGEEYMTVVDGYGCCTVWKILDKHGIFKGQKVFDAREIDIWLDSFGNTKSCLTSDGVLILADLSILVLYSLETEEILYQYDINHFDFSDIIISPWGNCILLYDAFSFEGICVDLQTFEKKKFNIHSVTPSLVDKEEKESVFDDGFWDPLVFENDNDNEFILLGCDYLYSEHSDSTTVEIYGFLWETEQTVLFSVSLKGRRDVIGFPVYMHNRVYLFSQKSVDRDTLDLCCFDPKEGALDWHTTITRSYYHSIEEPQLFSYGTSEYMVGCAYGNEVYFFSLANGALIAKHVFEKDIIKWKNIDGNILLFLLSDDSLVGLEALFLDDSLGKVVDGFDIKRHGIFHTDLDNNSNEESDVISNRYIFSDRCLYVWKGSFVDCFDAENGNAYNAVAKNDTVKRYIEGFNQMLLCPYGILVQDKFNGSLRLLDDKLNTIWTINHNRNFNLDARLMLTPDRSKLIAINPTDEAKTYSISVLSLENCKETETVVNEICIQGCQLTDHYLYYKNYEAGICRIRIDDFSMTDECVCKWSDSALTEETIRAQIVFSASPGDLYLAVLEPQSKGRIVDIQNNDHIINILLPEDEDADMGFLDDSVYEEYSTEGSDGFSEISEIYTEEISVPIRWSTNNRLLAISGASEAYIYDTNGEKQFSIPFIEWSSYICGFIEESLFVVDTDSFCDIKLNIYNTKGLSSQIDFSQFFDIDQEEGFGYKVISLTDQCICLKVLNGSMDMSRIFVDGDGFVENQNCIIIDTDTDTALCRIDHLADVFGQSGEILQYKIHKREEYLWEGSEIYEKVLWKKILSLDELIEYGSEMLRNLEVEYTAKEGVPGFW